MSVCQSIRHRRDRMRAPTTPSSWSARPSSCRSLPLQRRLPCLGPCPLLMPLLLLYGRRVHRRISCGRRGLREFENALLCLRTKYKGCTTAHTGAGAQAHRSFDTGAKVRAVPSFRLFAAIRSRRARSSLAASAASAFAARAALSCTDSSSTPDSMMALRFLSSSKDKRPKTWNPGANTLLCYHLHSCVVSFVYADETDIGIHGQGIFMISLLQQLSGSSAGYTFT